MRTVEQVITDLKRAREATDAAKATEKKYEKELQEIYDIVNVALQEVKKPTVYRDNKDGMI